MLYQFCSRFGLVSLPEVFQGVQPLCLDALGQLGKLCPIAAMAYWYQTAAPNTASRSSTSSQRPLWCFLRGFSGLAAFVPASGAGPFWAALRAGRKPFPPPAGNHRRHGGSYPAARVRRCQKTAPCGASSPFCCSERELSHFPAPRSLRPAPSPPPAGLPGPGQGPAGRHPALPL